jgi:hypothetical protein
MMLSSSGQLQYPYWQQRWHPSLYTWAEARQHLQPAMALLKQRAAGQRNTSGTTTAVACCYQYGFANYPS